MSIQNTLEYIHRIKWLGSRPGLSRTKELLAKIGNPEKKLKFVHVAGTNGKGSVCAFIASVLQKAGYKTGLYTSPYINVFNERMRINGENIPDADLEKLTDFIRPYADSMADPPTEFEVITAIAFEYFYENECDVVVLEVGMGGELDSTNVIDTPECAVITSIGLDHTKQLGSTLSLVASAKAGIIKGGDVVSYESTGEAWEVIEKKCEKVGANLEGIAFRKKSIYVCNSWNPDYSYNANLVKLNAETLAKEKDITVAVNPNQLIADGDHLFLASWGNYADVSPEIQQIDLLDNVTKLTNATHMAYANDYLYLINTTYDEKGNEVNSYSVFNVTTKEETTFIVGRDIDSPCTIAIDPLMGYVFIGSRKKYLDAEGNMAVSYTQPGYVVCYSSYGALINRFPCGVNPGTMVFATHNAKIPVY